MIKKLTSCVLAVFIGTIIYSYVIYHIGNFAAQYVHSGYFMTYMISATIGLVIVICLIVKQYR